MIFRNFRIGVISRILFIMATMSLWNYLVINTGYYVSITILAVMIIMQVVNLVGYVEKTNDKLTRFLDSIRYSDFSQSFPNRGMGRSFQKLNDAFSQVIEQFKKERAEKQESLRYLQTVVQHIGIGLISFKQDGEVELINTAAKRIFQIPTLRNIQALGDISGNLLDALMELKGGGRTLVRVQIDNETLQLAIYATAFRMHDEMYKLVSLQNIHSELEEKEMEAWQNLTQVLAHEIMNSITPIASLSDTVNMLLKQNAKPQNGAFRIEKESLQDVEEALSTINKRSQGLMRFVNSYRDFTQIPEPEFENFSVSELLYRIRNLNRGEAQHQGVSIEVEVEPETLEVTADPQLIEQVLINLTKNAFRALSEQEEGQVILRGKIDGDGRVLIQVKDNGPGIKQSNLEKIFIPFYSTSQPNSRGGSGIGLSLSRQILRMHHGTLTVTSNEKRGTTFTLRF